MLNIEDMELIEKASDVIKKYYDKESYNHTVAAALRCRNGNIYVGMNVFSMHGACAEQVAIGSAVANGDKEFECIVAIRGENGDDVLPPCGNCRQMFSDYSPDIEVIVPSSKGLIKVKAKELLPYSYKFDN